MDPQQPPITTQPEPQNSTSFLKNKKLLLIIALVVILLLATVAIIVFFSGEDNQQDTNNPNAQEQQYEQERQLLAEFAQPGAIVLYAAQSNNGIDVFAFDLQNTQEYFLTSLPNNIKQVTPISDNQLLYLSETDEIDYAKKITTRDLTTDSDSVLYEVIDNYGIDTYVVSPDKSYIVTWEVEVGPTGTLQGGNSRLRKIFLNDTGQNQIIAQQQITDSDPIFYPVLAKNDGVVYVDTFLPNSGAGWAYGMSKIDTNTNQVQSISSMQNGTYSSRPIASPNGTEILFAGYDGTQGNGSQTDENGFRTALIFANTIEILDTTTDQRQRLPNLPVGNTYLRTNWGQTPNTVIYAALDAQALSQESAYDINQGTLKQLDTSPDVITAAQLDNNLFLQGTISDDTSNFLSNLGSNTVYQYAYTNIALKDTTSNTSVTIPTSSSFVQYIDTIYTNSPQVQSEQDATVQQIFPEFNLEDIIDFGEKIGGTNREIQLRSFVVPTRPIEREIISEPEPDPQPTGPVGYVPAPQDPVPTTPQTAPTIPPNTPDERNCNDISNPICLAKYGVSKYADLAPEDIQPYKNCRFNLNIELKADGKCELCPLFLYGPNGKQITVKAHTNISSANAPTENNSFTATLNENGQISVGGKHIESISFDYIKQKNVKPPKYGVVVSRSKVVAKITEYSQKMGLKQREIEPILTEVEKTLATPYAFVSFYDQKTSKYLLPLTFDPKPDTYINYLFYIKGIKNKNDLGYSPKEPQFPEIEKRGETTAIETNIVIE